VSERTGLDGQRNSLPAPVQRGSPVDPDPVADGLSTRSLTTLPTDPAVVGNLDVQVDATGPLAPHDRRPVESIPRHLAEVDHDVLLARGVQASRRELILAWEEERRRLRRDLHDGLGPTLAALTMQIEVASVMVGPDPGGASELLAQLGRTTQAVIEDIRHIVDDLRPSGLDELGLVSAIREHVQPLDAASKDRPHGFAIDVHADGELGQLPAAVEVAAFRIAVEAVTIAARCPGGQHCVVRLRRGTELLLDICDDAEDRERCQSVSDVDLRSMRERATDLGGECTVEPGRDRPGSAVRVRLPLPGAESP
jgi:signal transduction histidine kinase